MTEDARRKLGSSGVGYVDGHGNAHIRLRGVYIHTAAATTVSQAPSQRYPSRLSGKAGLVAQAMLLEPGRTWQIAELAVKCDVSAGLVHRVVARLEAAELVAGLGAGSTKRRQLIRPGALLDPWAEEDTETRMRRYPIFALPVPTLSLAASSSAKLEVAGILHAVTGTAAAASLAPALTAVPVTEIRIGRTVPVEQVLATLDARLVEQGANVVLMQPSSDDELRFRQRPHHAWFTANTRIYLDTLRDPRRGREQAQAFRDAIMDI